MRKIILAAALIAPLAAMPLTASAQMDDDAKGALTMLEANTKNALEGYGIDVDVQSLSIGQLGAIHGIMNGEEPEGRKGARIMAIINNN